MQTRYRTSFTLFGLAALLLACATQRVEVTQGADGKSAGSSDAAQSDPRLDHIIAWIPRDRAGTATVAEALVHIELGRAKEEVGRNLCADHWPMNGAAVDSIGPLPSTAPAALGGYPAWYYRVSHEPGLAGCPGVTTDRLYRELCARLPRWITVKAASAQAGATAVRALATTTAALNTPPPHSPGRAGP